MSECKVPGLEILRKKYGLTQGALSLISGVDKSSISRIEAGLQNPTFSTMEALANALECTILNLVNPPRKGETGVSGEVRRTETETGKKG